MRVAVGVLMWHIHHESSIEILTEPLQNRIDYIKTHKPANETKTRLKWLTPVLHPEKLPRELLRADAKWEEAYAKWKEADAKWEEAYAKWKEADAKRKEAYAKWKEADAKRKEAYAKWKEACSKFQPQIQALHNEEHKGCPYSFKEGTLFPVGSKA